MYIDIHVYAHSRSYVCACGYMVRYSTSGDIRWNVHPSPRIHAESHSTYTHTHSCIYKDGKIARICTRIFTNVHTPLPFAGFHLISQARSHAHSRSPTHQSTLSLALVFSLSLLISRAPIFSLSLFLSLSLYYRRIAVHGTCTAVSRASDSPSLFLRPTFLTLPFGFPYYT